MKAGRFFVGGFRGLLRQLCFFPPAMHGPHVILHLLVFRRTLDPMGRRTIINITIAEQQDKEINMETLVRTVEQKMSNSRCDGK